MALFLSLIHIFGDYNPSGKLPMSFPRSVGQIPVYYSHLNTGRPYNADKPNKYTSAFSATALKVAASTEGILRQGFNEVNSMKVAQVLLSLIHISICYCANRD